MVVGAPGRALIDRVKVLSLLFDEVLLEAGAFEFTLGEQAGIEGPTSSDRWTTAAERSSRRRDAGELIVTSPDGTEKSRLSMDDAHYWRATLRPVLDDMGRAYDWVSSATVSLTEDGKRFAGEQLREAIGSPNDRGPLPVRDSVLYTETARDLVAGSALDSVVTMDGLHQQYLHSIVRAGVAAPVAGVAALWIACPHVTTLSWSDIDIARRRRGMSELRAVLAAIELEAIDAAAVGGAIDGQIRDRLVARILEASSSSGLKVWLGAARRSALSTIIGATPIGIPYAVGAELVGTWRRSGHWLAALSQLREDAKRGRTGDC